MRVIHLTLSTVSQGDFPNLGGSPRLSLISWVRNIPNVGDFPVHLLLCRACRGESPAPLRNHPRIISDVTWPASPGTSLRTFMLDFGAFPKHVCDGRLGLKGLPPSVLFPKTRFYLLIL